MDPAESSNCYMTSQKHLFNIPDHVHYLNGAYMSPLMKSVVSAGAAGMARKVMPWEIRSEEFFTQAEGVKQKFGRLINAPAQQVAIIPSASYGLKSAVNNIPPDCGNHAIVVGNDFPSDYYTVKEWCGRNKKTLKVLEAPNMTNGRGEAWTQKILDAITPETSAIILSTIHWADGTKYDLKRIGEKCMECDTYFIADGTQSVGALRMDVAEFNIDALVCAAYKWLLGPYSIGLAYYHEDYNTGAPIEDSWMNRSNADDFTSLSRYVTDYKPGAGRYNVGEFSNFIHLPMLDQALQQLEAWNIDAVQQYSADLIQPLLHFLNEAGYWIEDEEYRANHLFGILLPAHVDKQQLLKELQYNHVFVSVRGDSVRVSPHVYNEERDIQALIDVLKKNRS
jgi:selenocysteine lyase/cysteine desulfurase